MSELLDALDRAARAWAEARFMAGVRIGATSEEWGKGCVAAIEASKAYEEALAAVRAERQGVR